MSTAVVDYPGQAFRGDPPPLPEGPVARVRLPSGDPVWLVTGYAEVRSALNHPMLARISEEGADDPKAGSVTLSGRRHAHRTLQLDGPPHTSLRALASKAFTAQRVAGLRDRIQELTDTYLDRMEETGKPADLVSTLAYPLPIAVICELLGVPPEDQKLFVEWTDKLVTITGVRPEEVAAARGSLVAYLRDRLEAKRADPGDDLLSVWAAVQESDDRLVDEEVLHLAEMVLVGGFETTVNAIGAGMWRLFQNPDELDALKADPGLIPGAVEELLRFQPQAPMFLIFIARDDFELGGVTIRKGEGVMPLPFAANRDPSRFPDPDRFDVRRKGNGHITFGHGPHVCLGAALARMELEVAIGTLLRRFPGLRPAASLTELDWRSDRLVNGLRELPVAW
ncbi:cytochrome P450 [Streptomyces sp. NPDC048629]|uniref:cytochrome P450 n=1 Tax=Streptomyces sp. NPDC048629 TaxID=3154824 RepID=UPI00343AD73F